MGTGGEGRAKRPAARASESNPTAVINADRIIEATMGMLLPWATAKPQAARHLGRVQPRLAHRVQNHVPSRSRSFPMARYPLIGLHHDSESVHRARIGRVVVRVMLQRQTSKSPANLLRTGDRRYP